MMKDLLTGAALLAALAAVGAERTVPTVLSDWELCPLSWAAEGKVLRSVGPSDLAFVRDTPLTERVTISAELTPGERMPSDNWPVAGVAIGEGPRDYWHLALVQTPQEKGGHRFFELHEMRDGRWLANLNDRLLSLPGSVDVGGGWKSGETYRLRLETTAERIVGTITDAKGRTLFRAGYDLKGKLAVRGGRPGLNVKGGFSCAFGTVKVDQGGQSRPPVVESVSYPPYESASFVPGLTEKATGFFRVKQREDGKWWVFDPLGRATVIFGVDHVRWGGHWTSRTNPMRHRYLDHNVKSYPDRAAWEQETLGRLRKWGFNMLGAGSDRTLERRGLAHARNLSMGDLLTQENVDASFYICPNEHRPCSALPNMFHPRFALWCDYHARKHCAPNRDDPWLLGYFIDNELAWWGREHRQTGLWPTVLKLPEGHSARKALLAYAAEHGIVDPQRATTEQKLGFVRLAAQRYFAITTEAIRRHDPNHLVLGSRFAGVRGAPDVVWEESGKFCDMVTFNSYPYVDLDRDIIYNSFQDRSKTLVEIYAERQNLVKRPMLLTEWSFPALDSGLPCTSGAGQRFHTQKERAAATRLYAQTLLSLPYMVGYDYFMWVDQPPEGISDAFPEDSNYGLVSEKGVPYRELCAVFTELQTDIATARSRPLPKPKAAPVVSTGWQGPALPNWTVGGKDVGSYTVMLSYEVSGARQWQDCRRVKSCVKRSTPAGEIWTLVGEGWGPGGARFEMTHTMEFFRDRPNLFLAGVSAIRNTGKVALENVSVFFRTYAPYAIEPNEDYSDGQNVWSRRYKSVPNLWKGAKKGCWLAKDGRYIGVFSQTEAVGSVAYNADVISRTQYPDAVLQPAPVRLDLAVGETFASGGDLWFYVLGGTDGAEGWRKATEALKR